MSAMKDIAYDIEQLYIDGFSPSRIANILECPIGLDRKSTRLNSSHT